MVIVTFRRNGETFKKEFKTELEFKLWKGIWGIQSEVLEVVRIN